MKLNIKFWRRVSYIIDTYAYETINPKIERVIITRYEN